jgi:hypothetical protein
MIRLSRINWTTIGLLGLAIAVLVLIGCGKFDPPTASQPTTEQSMGLWNPGAGEKIGSGEIPRLEPGYWERYGGLTVNPTDRTVVAWVGASGGTLRLGPHTLVIPAGALDHYELISMSYASLTAVGVDCGPSPFHFNLPVTLTLSYTGTQYGRSTNAPNIDLYYMAPDGSTQELPSTIDPGRYTVTSQTDHFSRYILG